MDGNASVEEEDTRQGNRSGEEERLMSWNPSIEAGETLETEESLLQLEPSLRIPRGVGTLEGFRRWTSSESFPEHGRIDFLDGELEIDLSGENLFKHGTVKTAIAAVLHEQVAGTGKGAVFVDATRVVSVDASISVEPDVVAVLWETLASGRVRRVPVASGEPDSFIELEGAPDLVVEVISQSSVAKDRRRLPPLYARAGVSELWLVDARRRDSPVELSIHHLVPPSYVLAPVDAEGWCSSRFLGRRCRLLRHPIRDLGITYELELA
jgi:Uma2 family endonuclease